MASVSGLQEWMNDNEIKIEGITNVKSFLPIYKELPNYLENHVPKHNNIVVNSKKSLVVKSVKTNRIQKKQNIHIKYAPLINPIEYILGKYDHLGKRILLLPDGNSSNNDIIPKIKNIHNATYVDSLFYYISGQLNENDNFIHALTYYGSYIGIHSNFPQNITDDISYLQNFPIFTERQKQGIYSISEECNYLIPPVYSNGSRGNRQKEVIVDDSEIVDDLSILGIIDLQEPYTYTNIQNDDTITFCQESTLEMNTKMNSVEEDEEEEDDEDDEEEDDDEDDEDDEEDEDDDEEYEELESEIVVNIPNFPTNCIIMEKCDGKLDDLFMDIENCETLSDEITNQFASALFQVIMTLIHYQKLFEFTHNDLHTNNIMYNNTDITHLVYIYEGKTYKIPTFGRIFKIIDFGRSIYTYKGKRYCSDDFEKGGDASTQYNCEPFYNNYKKRIDPNFSFDLCRLGCSIIDFLMDTEQLPKKESEILALPYLSQLVLTWCSDDMGKNVMYKPNGQIRYNGFTLYKMIAKNVHNHLPEKQLSHPLFSTFFVKKPTRRELHKKGEIVKTMRIGAKI